MVFGVLCVVCGARVFRGSRFGSSQPRARAMDPASPPRGATPSSPPPSRPPPPLSRAARRRAQFLRRIARHVALSERLARAVAFCHAHSGGLVWPFATWVGARGRLRGLPRGHFRRSATSLGRAGAVLLSGAAPLLLLTPLPSPSGLLLWPSPPPPPGWAVLSGPSSAAAARLPSALARGAPSQRACASASCRSGVCPRWGSRLAPVGLHATASRPSAMAPGGSSRRSRARAQIMFLYRARAFGGARPSFFSRSGAPRGTQTFLYFTGSRVPKGAQSILHGPRRSMASGPGVCI